MSSEFNNMEANRLDCLDIPEVMRTVFGNLSNADCLSLSRVNRVWHHEAQSVLRDRGSLTAKLSADYAEDDATWKEKDLRAFAADLRRMREVRKVVPFSGLTLDPVDWCQEGSTGEWDQVYEEILHLMDWKHLALESHDYLDEDDDCVGFQLVKKILHNCSGLLEEFSLEITRDHEGFIQYFLQECNFSRLKTLTFEGQGREEEGKIGDEDLIKALVSHAPNLQVLCTKERVNLGANLLEGSAALHLIDHLYCLVGELDNIPEAIVGEIRMKKLKLCLTSDTQVVNLEKFNTIVPMMLQNSRTILSWMQVDAAFLLPLMHYGIYLENLRKLGVYLYTSDVSQPRSRRLLKSLDFSRMFPNLNAVTIWQYDSIALNREHARNAMIDMVERGNTPLIQRVNPSANIKKLRLHGSCPDACLGFLGEILPHIQIIDAIANGVPFVRFWDYWSDLEELDINLIFTPEVGENLDSAFCGIFPQEVADLREQDEEYLRSVHIVPVMPSLSCLKRLRTFSLHFEKPVAFTDDPPSMLTEVTGRIAFQRCPDLTVTLTTNNERWKRGLQHMETYASVRQAESHGFKRDSDDFCF